MASIPLVEGRHALRGEKPNRSTLKQGCGGCRVRSEFKNRTEPGLKDAPRVSELL